ARVVEGIPCGLWISARTAWQNPKRTRGAFRGRGNRAAKAATRIQTATGPQLPTSTAQQAAHEEHAQPQRSTQGIATGAAAAVVHAAHAEAVVGASAAASDATVVSAGPAVAGATTATARAARAAAIGDTGIPVAGEALGACVDDAVAAPTLAPQGAAAIA